MSQSPGPGAEPEHLARTVPEEPLPTIEDAADQHLERHRGGSPQEPAVAHQARRAQEPYP